MAAEFTLESVRQYMLAHEGRVTNHDLVKHYKAWLTHPTLKESSRQKFKEYVNTLSTIKVEEGVKYLVLKRKFFPTFAEPSPQNTNELSLLDEVLGAYDRRSGQPPQLPPVYKAPPPPNYRQPPPPPPPSHVANIGKFLFVYFLTPVCLHFARLFAFCLSVCFLFDNFVCKIVGCLFTFKLFVYIFVSCLITFL